MIYLYVAVGGIMGALGRLAAGNAIGAPAPGSVPWATLLINLTGSVLLGFLMRALPAWGAPEHVRALLTVGFCGSFTTFSTFGFELAALVQVGAYPVAAAYAIGSVMLGVVGVFLGLGLASLVA